jgi:hypothetical protein
MKILILAANPSNTHRLRLDREVRDIEEGLIRAQQRDCFEVIQRWAVSFHSHRRRAYARQNAPTWAERSFWEHCGRHPQPSWYRGSLFGPNPTHQQMLDYYSYLQKSANRLSKNQDWICQEFEKECGAGSWKQLINLRRKILGDTHPDAPPACLI